MTVRTVLAIVALAVSGTMTSALAQPALRQVVLNRDLNQFVGRNVFGFAQTNLGVVTIANQTKGIIGVIGRHGEYARISASLLTRNGMILYAPDLTAGDIKIISQANFAHSGAFLAAPHFILIDPGG